MEIVVALISCRCCAGITWILSDEVVFMRKTAWAERLQQLAALKQREGTAAVDARMHSETLHDWLEHQKALLAIGAAPFPPLQLEPCMSPCLGQFPCVKRPYHTGVQPVPTRQALFVQPDINSIQWHWILSVDCNMGYFWVVLSEDV